MQRDCPVPGCGKRIGKLETGRHFRTKHPEYIWIRETRNENITSHYYCSMLGCKLGIAGFNDMVRHYELYHPEVKHNLKEDVKQPGVISASNLTVSALDRLIEQVNINTGLLKEEQKRNRELIEKCTAYAGRIVELQNQLAQDTTRRY